MSKAHAGRTCIGLHQAEKATCLSDLLFNSPPAWLEQSMLRRRLPDGNWQRISRVTVQQAVLRVAAWLQSKGVKPGDRVGLLGHNCVEWLLSDFAILRLGAITVPAYFTDPPEAVRYVLKDAGCTLVLAQAGEQQAKLDDFDAPVLPFTAGEGESVAAASEDVAWDGELKADLPDRGMLATLIYTSGTTGKPKGVMLTHGNLLSDVAAGLGGIPVWPDDTFLSFLPASHAFERTVGHFIPVACGAEIAYAEDVTTLMRDMPEVKPTVMISVPRLYEKIYAGVNEKLQQGSAIKRWLFNTAQKLGIERFELQQQGRDLGGLKARLWGMLDHLVNAKLREKMGGRLRLFVSGGAALSPNIARFLLAAGIKVAPGYGLTEASPVLTVNREDRIRPETIGTALPGVELRLAGDGELLARGPMIMQGYWHNPEATAEAIDEDGWLHTGDIAEIDDDGYVKIVDRKKEIMVMSNGENVPPALVEQHITQDPCILQAMVIGDQRPHLVALVVADREMLEITWKRTMRRKFPDDWVSNPLVHGWLRTRMQKATRELPSYMRIHDFSFVQEEWTQANGLLTPTLKLKRRKIAESHAAEIESLYEKTGD